MFNIKILCVGKLKEKFYAEAVSESMKRLSGYCRLEIEELAESRLSAAPSDAEINAALAREAASIKMRIPKDALVIAMCIEGKELDSRQLSEFIDLCGVNGKNRICFIIGGSVGLDESIKKEAALKLSMSRMTFPHHLARVMLLEQLYRGFKISEGAKYHK